MSATRIKDHAPPDGRRLRELRQLVAHGEGQHLEFKRKATFPEKIVREMVAFANTGGGIVLIGVDDDGTISGLRHPEDEAYVIQQALALCRPALDVREDAISLGNGRCVLRYDIAESTRKPHVLLRDGIKEAFVRVGHESIRASREVREIVRRAQRKRNIQFHYGEHEKILMQYLDTHEFITLKDYMTLGNLSRVQASRKLILLVLARVLFVTPHGLGDRYSRLSP
ncbi:MAG: ATP-binding protein [Cyclobacteriaceae bacterium]|jgi:predicted HTH transcriptional regulator|nr:ATP-binding protein [Cyclobacteriaceae bacterium]